MKKFLTVAFVSVSLLAAPAFADATTGVVNVAKILKDSKAATSVRNQMQAKQKSLQAEVSEKAKQLHSEDQSLVKQKDSADKSGFEKKVKDFQEKAAKEERAVQEKKVALDKSFAAALEDIQKNVLDITKQVAAEKKLTMVVSNAQVLYADPSLDITDEVLKRLDAKLPNVAVKF